MADWAVAPFAQSPEDALNDLFSPLPVYEAITEVFAFRCRSSGYPTSPNQTSTVTAGFTVSALATTPSARCNCWSGHGILPTHPAGPNMSMARVWWVNSRLFSPALFTNIRPVHPFPRPVGSCAGLTCCRPPRTKHGLMPSFPPSAWTAPSRTTSSNNQSRRPA